MKYGVKNLQAAVYNGARTVNIALTKERKIAILDTYYELKFRNSKSTVVFVHF